VVPRAQPGPGSTVAVGRELGHVDPELGHEGFRRPLLNAGDGPEAIGLRL
jgi:hypothetical protein